MKNRSTLLFILILMLMAGLLGYNYFVKPFANLSVTPIDKTVVSPSPESTLSHQEEQIQELTDTQKISQLLAVPYTITIFANGENSVASSAATLAWIKEYQPGLVTLFGQNIEAQTAAQKIAQIKSLRTLSSPVWIAVDHEGGTVQRLNGEGFTKLPSWSVLCGQTDAKATELLTKSAAELKQVGVDVVLAPVTDVGNNAALNSRICSTDVNIVVSKATQFLSIFEKQGLLPVVKHFPGIGRSSRDLHQKFDQVTIGAEEAQIYRSLLSNNSRLGVMVAPVGVKNQYPDIPCVLSSDCVAELSQNFPQVLVLTDALEMKANFHVSEDKLEPSLSEVAEQAIQSGNQVLVFGPSVNAEQLTQIVNDLSQKYQTDATFKARVDAALNQLITYKNINK